jgi:hypothetical protein
MKKLLLVLVFVLIPIIAMAGGNVPGTPFKVLQDQIDALKLQLQNIQSTTVKPDLMLSQHFFGNVWCPELNSTCFPSNPNPPDPFSHPGINFGAEYRLMRNADGTPVSTQLFSDWYSFTWVHSYKLKCVYPEYVLNFPEGTPVCP